MTSRGEATIVPITRANTPLQIHYSIIPVDPELEHFILHVIPSLKQDDDLAEAIQTFLAEHPAPEGLLIRHSLVPMQPLEYARTPVTVGDLQGYKHLGDVVTTSTNLDLWQRAVEESGIFPPGVRYDRAGYSYFHEKPIAPHLFVPPQDL